MVMKPLSLETMPILKINEILKFLKATVNFRLKHHFEIISHLATNVKPLDKKVLEIT